MDSALVLARTRKWVANFIVGHNFCPFAAKPLQQNKVRFVASEATDQESLMMDLWQEATHLLDQTAEQLETTILVHPEVLTSFEDYLDFLGAAELLLEEREWDDELQIASFHPDYLFDGVDPEDNSHYTNRSPYPMLHLLRQDSVSWAVDTHPDIESVPERNVAWLQAKEKAEIRQKWDEFRTFVPDQSLE